MSEDLILKIDKRILELSALLENAERRGPSQPGYVRDATYYAWVGALAELEGLKNA